MLCNLNKVVEDLVLLAKPIDCIGCPLYDDGQGFVPDEVQDGQSVFIFAQNPGEQEEHDGRPMVGATGKVNDETYIPFTGLERGKDIGVGNSIRCRAVIAGKRSNLLPPVKILKAAQSHCNAAHLKIPDSVKLVVAHGAAAWDYTQGKAHLSIDDWRGFIGPHKFHDRPVLATIHTAALFRNPKLIQIAKLDWRKIGAFIRGEWPLPIPPRIVMNERVVGIVIAQPWIDWFDAAEKADYVVLDTEYVVALDKKITLIGLLYEDEKGIHGLQYPFVSSGSMAGLRGAFVERLSKLVTCTPIVGQNTVLADVDCIERNWGIPYSSYLKCHDVMLMHHCLWAELPHSLEFLASVYSRYPKMKHLAGADALLYNWGDCLVTNETLKVLLKEAGVSVSSLRQPTLAPDAYSTRNETAGHMHEPAGDREVRPAVRGADIRGWEYSGGILRRTIQPEQQQGVAGVAV